MPDASETVVCEPGSQLNLFVESVRTFRVQSSLLPLKQQQQQQNNNNHFFSINNTFNNNTLDNNLIFNKNTFNNNINKAGCYKKYFSWKERVICYTACF